MSTISAVTYEAIAGMVPTLGPKLKACATLDKAAQTFCDTLFDELRESVALVRVYATVPYQKLPDANRHFVDKLTTDLGVKSTLRDDTLVISLMGTRGQNADWNDRRKSKGHVGIPLCSASFVDSIPMMSRLLRAMGKDLAWIDSKDSKIVSSVLGTMSGVFYVADAATEKDSAGRVVIPAVDFVTNNGVKSVFGFGAGYMIGNVMAIFLFFCKESVSQEQAARFQQLANGFKTATLQVVSLNRLFS